MAIDFQRESIAGLWGELHPLLDAHYHEISADKTIPLCPDTERYDQLDAAGVIHTYTARLEGELIGYAIFFVQPHLHYATTTHALQDVIFIAREHRRGTLGLRLIRYCDRQLQSEGIHVVHHHIKAAHNWGPILERMGYRLQDLIYTRRLN